MLDSVENGLMVSFFFLLVWLVLCGHYSIGQVIRQDQMDLFFFIHFAGNKSLGTPFALLGKFAVAAAFGVIYLYSAELFPTQVRNIGLGVTSVGARLGGILAPIVLMTVSWAYLNNGFRNILFSIIIQAQYSHSIPMLLMGILALGTGLLSLTLPETLNKPMPDTLKDLENL